MSSKNITSIKDILDFINSNPSNDSNFERFYRGVNKVHTIEEDLPKLARTNCYDLKNQESDIIKQALTYRPDYFKDCHSAIEKLEILQHYRFPTRLLDVTTNPLVALYFACSGQDSIDGQINVYDIMKSNIKFNDSDTVSVLANLAFMPSDFYLEFTEPNGNPNDTSTNYKKLIHQIRTEKSYFEGAIVAEHLKGFIVCVKPIVNNPRMAAQEGAFLLFGDLFEEYEPIKVQNKLTIKRYSRKFPKLSEKYNQGTIKWQCLTIPHDKKANIIHELSTIGIDEQKLFPELEVFAKKFNQKS